MTNADDGGEDRQGHEEPQALQAVKSTPARGAPAANGDQTPADVPFPPRTGQRVSDARRRDASSRRGAKRLPDETGRTAVPTRGQADAIVMPILGTLVGLMAIGALGFILISRKKSKSRAALMFAALGATPARWVDGAAKAEHRLVSDLSGRAGRIRRSYGI